MANWEYRTLLYGSPQAPPEALRRWQYWIWPWAFAKRRWVICPTRAEMQIRQVGDSEKARFIGKILQAMRLLETALKELDAEGWELVSTSFSGIFNLYGTAVLRRLATKDQQA